MSIKKILIICLIMFTTAFVWDTAFGAPALKHDAILTQADGRTFLATPYGDEWHNGYETKDGYTILFDKRANNWVYADIAADGSLIESGLVVNRDVPIIPQHIRPFLSEGPDMLQSQNYYNISAGPSRPTNGNQRALVILVRFSNRTLMTTEAQWDNLIFNGITFSSIRHYFREVSYNNIDLVPALESYGTPDNGVVIVTLPYNHPNTAGNTGNTNRQITRDALVAADPYVDFALFDADSNGYLSTDELHIVIVVAGYETSFSGPVATCGPSVWAHMWSLGGTVSAPTLDGKVVAAGIGDGAYVQVGEWHCSTSVNPGHMATTGVIAHELGHSIWLPDEYDTDGSSEGIGNWGLMGSGSWNTCSGGHFGNCPSHLTAWDKWYLGWLIPTKILGLQTVNIPDITTNPIVYQLRDNPNGVDWSFGVVSGTGEYFLVENRQRRGYNAGLPGDGLLIWHIWEGAPYDNRANQNETGRRLIDLREADGLRHLDLSINRGDAGDPFPGTSNKTVFNNNSNPSSKLYCSSGTGFCNPSYVSITGISASGPTMSATISTSVLQFSTSSYTVNESTASAIITVQRLGDISGSATVNYATSNGTATASRDYTAVSGTLTFVAGQNSKTFSVPIINDAIAELAETVNLTLSSPVGATLGNPRNATLTIKDNEPSQVQFRTSSYTVNETSTRATITVQRLGSTSGTTTVNYATSNGTATAGYDYTAQNGTLTFTAGQNSKTFSVPIINDAIAELAETVNLTLSSPVGATLGNPRNATLTIISDD